MVTKRTAQILRLLLVDGRFYKPRGYDLSSIEVSPLGVCLQSEQTRGSPRYYFIETLDRDRARVLVEEAEKAGVI